MTRFKKSDNPVKVQQGISIRLVPTCLVPWKCSVEGGVHYKRQEASEPEIDAAGRERVLLASERVIDFPAAQQEADRVRAAVRRKMLALAPLTDFGPILPVSRLPEFRGTVGECRDEVEQTNARLTEAVTARQAELNAAGAGVRLRTIRIVFAVLYGRVLADEVGAARTILRVVIDHLLDLDRLISTGEPGDPVGDHEAIRKVLKNRPGLDALVEGENQTMVAAAVDCARECANAWAKRSRGTMALIDKSALSLAILRLTTAEATFGPAGDAEQLELAFGRGA